MRAPCPPVVSLSNRSKGNAFRAKGDAASSPTDYGAGESLRLQRRPPSFFV